MNENRAVRVAINFDLSTKVLEDIFGKNNTGKPYSDIKLFMEENGFTHRQYSGYVSIEPKTDADIMLLGEKMNRKFSWFGEAVKNREIDVTEIGSVYSLKSSFTDLNGNRLEQQLRNIAMENKNNGQDFLFMSSN